MDGFRTEKKINNNNNNKFQIKITYKMKLN